MTTRVLLAGLGQVGVRAARQLLDTEGVDEVLVACRDRRHADEAAHNLADGAVAVDLDGDQLPDDVAAVVSALPAGPDAILAARALRAGVPFVSATDDSDGLRELRHLDDSARAAGSVLVAGCGLAPGIGDVLAGHAADALDSLDEVHVARWGVSGPASAAAAARARRLPARELLEGAVRDATRAGAELVWFPDPVNGRECVLVDGGVELIAGSRPGIARATVRLGVPTRRWWKPLALGLGPTDPGATWGALRVEAWGWRSGTRTAIVYGMIERVAVASGAALGVTGAWLGGALPALGPTPAPGVHGAGAVLPAVAFLAELDRRGVRAAAFEGVGVS